MWNYVESLTLERQQRSEAALLVLVSFRVRNGPDCKAGDHIQADSGRYDRLVGAQVADAVESTEGSMDSDSDPPVDNLD